MNVIKALTICVIVVSIGVDCLHFPLLKKLYGKVRHRHRSKSKSSNNKQHGNKFIEAHFPKPFLRYDFNQHLMPNFDFGDPYAFHPDYLKYNNPKHKDGKSHHKKTSPHKPKKGGSSKNKNKHQHQHELNYQVHSPFNPPIDDYQKQLEEMHRSQAYINNLVGLDYSYPQPTKFPGFYNSHIPNYPTFHTLSVPPNGFINPTEPTFANFFNPDDFQNDHKSIQSITQTEDFAAIALKALRESGFNDFGGKTAIGNEDRFQNHYDRDHTKYGAENQDKIEEQQQNHTKLGLEDSASTTQRNFGGTEDFFEVDLNVHSSQMPPFTKTHTPFLQATYQPSTEKSKENDESRKDLDKDKDQQEKNDRHKEGHQYKLNNNNENYYTPKQHEEYYKPKHLHDKNNDVFKNFHFDKTEKNSPNSLSSGKSNKAPTSYVEFLNHEMKFEYATHTKNTNPSTKNIIDADLHHTTSPSVFHYLKNSSPTPTTSFTKLVMDTIGLHGQSTPSAVPKSKMEIHLNNYKPTTYSPILHNMQIKKNVSATTKHIYAFPTQNNILHNFPETTSTTTTTTTTTTAKPIDLDEHAQQQQNSDTYNSVSYQQNTNDYNTNPNGRPIQLYNVRNESKVLRYSQPLYYIPVQNMFHNAYQKQEDSKLKPAYSQPFQYTLDNTNYVSKLNFDAQPAKPYGVQNETKTIQYSQPFNYVPQSNNYNSHNYYSNAYTPQQNTHYQSRPMFSEPVQYTPAYNNIYDNKYNAHLASNANSINNGSKPIRYSQPLPNYEQQSNTYNSNLGQQYKQNTQVTEDNCTEPNVCNNKTVHFSQHTPSQLLPNPSTNNNSGHLDNYSQPSSQHLQQHPYLPTNYSQNAQPVGTTPSENPVDSKHGESDGPLRIHVPDEPFEDNGVGESNSNVSGVPQGSSTSPTPSSVFYNNQHAQYQHQPKYTAVTTERVEHKDNPFNQNQIFFNYNYYPKSKAIYSVPSYEIHEKEVQESQNNPNPNSSPSPNPNSNPNLVVAGHDVIKIVDASHSMLNNSYVNNNGWTPILFK